MESFRINIASTTRDVRIFQITASRLHIRNQQAKRPRRQSRYIQRFCWSGDSLYHKGRKFMFRHLAIVFSLGSVIFLGSSVAQAQFGGLSFQIGGSPYGNSNFRNFGYGNPYYGNYGNFPNSRNFSPGYRSYNNGYVNNGYYNRRFNNNLNNTYRYTSPNYRIPQRGYSIPRARRW